jgi:hypothetical protein
MRNTLLLLCGGALMLFSGVASLVLAFWHADKTAARLWIEYPETYTALTSIAVAGLIMMIVAINTKD